jgi:anti-sigma factor RsiW
VTGIAEQLSCQELVELVTDYLDGALPPPDRARFEAHIAECDGCRAYLEQIRATITLTGTLVSEQIDPAAEAALLQAFRNWKGSRT